ncbi:MAG TPA: DNRLRE domain-containing protein, partial [Candidatus Krumholzibacteria bacterium]|nr:DNRLRE domain-containing protein [Candidatus Krumholzibacteria bacterium]
CGNDDNPPVAVDSAAPAKVTDLAIADAGENSITLTWTAPGDDGTRGTATSYILKESGAEITSANFGSATEITGVPAPGAAGAAETFTVTPIDTLVNHYFAIRAKDEAGNTAPVSVNVHWQPRSIYEATIVAFLDNTLYEESDTLSNALGQNIYSGTNNGGAGGGPDARRGLIQFDIASALPAGAVIDSVSLRLNQTRTSPIVPGFTPTALHVVLASWGEGTSIGNLGPNEGGGGSATPGDATWLDRFRGTSLWTTPGGDFVVTASATTSTNNVLGPYFWTSAQMAADVQAWLDTPATNFGWILVGDEVTGGTARQFDSHDHPTAANRPQLTVFYRLGP